VSSKRGNVLQVFFVPRSATFNRQEQDEGNSIVPARVHIARAEEGRGEKMMREDRGES
jgi:hypothetical protein